MSMSSSKNKKGPTPMHPSLSDQGQRRMVVKLQRYEPDNGSIPSSLEMDEDDFQWQGLQATSKSSNNQGPPTAATNETSTDSRVPCFAVILWSPKILKELELHAKYEDKLLSTLGIGRMLSEVVVNENGFMDWKKPFILLDVMYDEGFEVTGNYMDHSINIPVQEKRVADNRLAPVSSRLWELTVSQCFLTLGLEIIRVLPTTLMIWGARKVVHEDQNKNKPFKGEIHLDTYSGPVNILIFHGEEITRERIRSIQGDFFNSELGPFNKGFRRRIINNQCTVCSPSATSAFATTVTTKTFSVHLSKLVNLNPVFFKEFESKSQAAQQVVNPTEKAQTCAVEATIGDEMDVASDMLNVISRTIPGDEQVSLGTIAHALVQELAEPMYQNSEVVGKDEDDKANESAMEGGGGGNEANSSTNSNGMMVEDEDDSVSRFAATQTLTVDTDDDDENDDKVDKSMGGERVEISNVLEIDRASQASEYRFTDMLEELVLN
ncbi:unnamed protein product [Orchesella dallaii]|uniref:Uncharacterized protein n=1 Tax=Orchesella dallaii TaxID=48710 RepID=A0ABP1QPB8_9HEXA